MSKVPVSPDWTVSRRCFLKSAAFGGAALGAGLAATPAQAKVPQKIAKYQTTPKGNQRCDNCSLWRAPSSCQLVDGTIAPGGWCNLYKAK